MPTLDVSAQWFAMVKGNQLGPFDIRGLEGKVKTGELSLRTYLWKQGMSDWKRASDVPELSMVFAGVASAPVASPQPPASNRDVAVAPQTAAPEITNKPNGTGHGQDRAASVPPGVAAKPRGVSQIMPQTAAKPVATPAPALAPVAAKPTANAAPLFELFGEPEAPRVDEDATSTAIGSATLDTDGPDSASGEEDEEGDEDKAQLDPFAALGGDDPGAAPPPGEATKFFIAQAGVNKRNPWWKIALFVVGFPAGAIGVLFLLSTFHIVSGLEVTRTNEKGEEVRESFFSAGGVSGLKDLLSGDAAKRKAQAEKARLAAAAAAAAEAAERRRIVAPSANEPEEKAEKPGPPKAVDPALALIYGSNDDRGPSRLRVRASDRADQQATDNTAGGLSQEATQKVIGDKIKAFQSCIEQALRRNPNLAVGPIEVVANVGSSGAVTSSNIAPAKYENSDWGNCMRDVAKRIVFPKSEGETEVRIPLKVGVAVPL